MQKLIRGWGWALVITGVVMMTLPAMAAEVIEEFVSDSQIQTDGNVVVTETITVISEQRQIKRGIYRQFPTTYRTPDGRRTRVRFDVVDVLRNGRPEAYHLKSEQNGQRVYIGQKDRFIEKGRHVYTLTYVTDRQLGFFKDFDEFYWNATGNDWNFLIKRAVATVSLPLSAEFLSTEAYTGRRGQQGTDYRITLDENGRTQFVTTRTLQPLEGMTIVVTWPKGLVVEPSKSDRAGYMLRDYPGIWMGLVGLLGLFAYYYWAWVRVGRDPETGVIIPLYEPPAGLSPAAIRFIIKRGFDNDAFAAAVVNLAVKGALTIKDSEKNYVLTKTSGGQPLKAPLSKGEAEIMKSLFSGSKSSIKLERKNHVRIRGAISALKLLLRKEFDQIYFLNNRKYLIPGAILSVITLVLLIVFSQNIAVGAFLGLWLSGWSVGVIVLGVRAWRAWQGARKGSIVAVIGALFATFFFIPFLGAEVVVLGVLAKTVPFGGILMIALLVGLNICFFHLLEAPTVRGRATMDQIEGLKLYMAVAEKDRMNLLNPPEQTPQLFEKLLPYALAMGVEQAWSEQFAGVLERAAQEGGYHPSWYSGHRFSTGNLSGFSASVGSSLRSAVSASSTAPGSSSGSGGGGSSGGGGGGGGGGGW